MDVNFGNNLCKLLMTAVPEWELRPLMSTFAVALYLSATCESCYYFQIRLKTCAQKFLHSFQPHYLNSFPHFRNLIV